MTTFNNLLSKLYSFLYIATLQNSSDKLPQQYLLYDQLCQQYDTLQGLIHLLEDKQDQNSQLNLATLTTQSKELIKVPTKTTGKYTLQQFLDQQSQLYFTSQGLHNIIDSFFGGNISNIKAQFMLQTADRFYPVIIYAGRIISFYRVFVEVYCADFGTCTFFVPDQGLVITDYSKSVSDQVSSPCIKDSFLLHSLKISNLNIGKFQYHFISLVELQELHHSYQTNFYKQYQLTSVPLQSVIPEYCIVLTVGSAFVYESNYPVVSAYLDADDIQICHGIDLEQFKKLLTSDATEINKNGSYIFKIFNSQLKDINILIDFPVFYEQQLLLSSKFQKLGSCNAYDQLKIHQQINEFLNKKYFKSLHQLEYIQSSFQLYNKQILKQSLLPLMSSGDFTISLDMLTWQADDAEKQFSIMNGEEYFQCADGQFQIRLEQGLYMTSSIQDSDTLFSVSVKLLKLNNDKKRTWSSFQEEIVVFDHQLKLLQTTNDSFFIEHNPEILKTSSLASKYLSYMSCDQIIFFSTKENGLHSFSFKIDKAFPFYVLMYVSFKQNISKLISNNASVLQDLVPDYFILEYFQDKKPVVMIDQNPNFKQLVSQYYCQNCQKVTQSAVCTVSKNQNIKLECDPCLQHRTIQKSLYDFVIYQNLQRDKHQTPFYSPMVSLKRTPNGFYVYDHMLSNIGHIQSQSSGWTGQFDINVQTFIPADLISLIVGV